MKFIYYYPGRWVPVIEELLTGEAHRKLAQAAEKAGFYGVSLDEHPAPVLPWLNHGHHCIDPFVGLAGVAAATSKIKLMSYLAILPYRNPFLFTKAATSLDVMSDGRAILGVGVGYLKGEFEALGVDFDKRNELFAEALDIFRRACAGEPVSHEGETFSAKDVVMIPRPIQRPHPPLWIGGNSKLTRRRIAEFGQGWLPMPQKRDPNSIHKTPPLENPQDMKDMLEYMFEHADKVGRKEPIEVVMSCGMYGKAPLDEIPDILEEYRAVGVTGVTINGAEKTVEAEAEAIARFSEVVMTRFAD